MSTIRPGQTSRKRPSELFSDGRLIKKRPSETDGLKVGYYASQNRQPHNQFHQRRPCQHHKETGQNHGEAGNHALIAVALAGAKGAEAVRGIAESRTVGLLGAALYFSVCRRGGVLFLFASLALFIRAVSLNI